MNNRFFLFAIIIAIVGIGFIACNDNNNDSKSKNLQTKLSPVSNREKGEMVVSYTDTYKNNNVFRFHDMNDVFNWSVAKEDKIIFNEDVIFEEDYFPSMTIDYDSIENNFSVYMEDGNKVTLSNFRDMDKNAVSFDIIGEQGTTPTIIQYDSLDTKALFFYLLNYNGFNKNGDNIKKVGPIVIILIDVGIALATITASCLLQQRTEINRCKAKGLCAKIIRPCGAECYECKPKTNK